jgi:hypothetical protein
MLTCTLTGTQLHKHTGYTTVHVPCTLPEPLSHFSNAPPTVLPARLSCLCCLLVWATKDSVRMHAHTQAPKNAPTTQCLPPLPPPPAASLAHLLVLPVGMSYKGLCADACSHTGTQKRPHYTLPAPLPPPPTPPLVLPARLTCLCCLLVCAAKDSASLPWLRTSCSCMRSLYRSWHCRSYAICRSRCSDSSSWGVEKTGKGGDIQEVDGCVQMLASLGNKGTHCSA